MSGPGQLEERKPPTKAIGSLCQRLFEASGAALYGLDADAFRTILLGIATQYAPNAEGPELVRFLETLKVEELALARGCSLGNEKAWEVFLTRYRSHLYGAAYTIAKDDEIAKELADSLYAELYGLPGNSGKRVSKLEYYKGRGSLEGWLRTVLAQEFVNRYRRTKREVSLEEKVEAGVQFAAATEAPFEQPKSMLDDATSRALAGLPPDDRLLLASYFLDGRTLAEIGRIVGVHESTVSRKLERLTTGLRKAICRELIATGATRRQADEMLQDMDVRDLNVNVRANLGQDAAGSTFYKSNEP